MNIDMNNPAIIVLAFILAVFGTYIFIRIVAFGIFNSFYDAKGRFLTKIKRGELRWLKEDQEKK